MRHEADRAEQARASGSDDLVESVRASARRVLDRIAVLLLQSDSEPENAAALAAIAATCAAEFARIDGRDDPSRWEDVARCWALTGNAEEVDYASRRAEARPTPPRDPR